MEETLTTTECMKILRITRPTILKLIKDKKLKAFKVGSVYRIKKADLEKFTQVGDDEPKVISGTGR
jgi:excisionase family DNA binding protein